MLARDSDNEWEALGRSDPYYGVLSHERFRKAKLTDTALNEFFTSGQEHVDFLLATIRASLDSNYSPRRALDFGCGLGRCAIPLARLCQSVVGVDVSDSMLRQAKQICEQHSVHNLELRKADDRLSNVSGSFDLVHAFLVFQHIHPSRGEKIFTRLIQLLSNDGIAVVQVVYHREEPAYLRLLGKLRRHLPGVHNAVNLLSGKSFSEPLMEKNVYDLNRLIATLHQNNCGNLHIKVFGNSKLRSAILIFQKKRDSVPYDES